jgi:hypothetical protein
MVSSGDTKKGYNQFKNDVYSLGISLLIAFFFNTPPTPEILIRSIANYDTTY